MNKLILRMARLWLCLLLSAAPSLSHALGCWNGKDTTGAVSATLTLPSNLYVAANVPVGTVIWQSPLQTLSLYCTQSIGEDVYFWVNPQNQTLAAGVQIGILFNGVTYTRNSGAIDTGIYVPWYGAVKTSLQYSIVLIKTANAPSSGSVNVSQYSVFQLDGVGGINITPNINFNQLISGTVFFTPGGTCNLSAGGQYTVNLPIVGGPQFAAVGSALARSYFTISAQNCSTGVKTATFRFSGTSDSDNPVLFANTGGSAKGVAINLGSVADGANIGANATNNTRVVNVQSQAAQLGLFAEYVRTNTVMPGGLQTAITIDMLYQ
ncbi:fimbrial protein [Chromobacterium sp. IIBBL 290-4]|uniref:fimbrial protein n=1 Tax=Chromobacterium sp. IIBBL 290-4 TaxID=2953890 RepID=UPI0020B68C1A|nr:fimbrial protein [Chromobacterium sp. IIBBL 290-4]UTH74784.1 type 1 fimbrial protein [Chromobacterium sp. IIBBL 290-4]